MLIIYHSYQLCLIAMTPDTTFDFSPVKDTIVGEVYLNLGKQPPDDSLFIPNYASEKLVLPSCQSSGIPSETEAKYRTKS
ncbi:MAG: hypothetical protein H7X99_08020 [Saprospiraceae bacterium]|nr:hypothetical protein [Saprospiraceae bacterium]